MLSLIAIIASIWIVLPPANMGLLPLRIIAIEISPILVLFNLFSLFISSNKWLSLLALIISLIPLIQFPSTRERCKQAIEEVIGTKYLTLISGVIPQEIVVETDREFAHLDGVKLTFNVYRPQREGKYPTLIMIYGGAWRSGNPNNNQVFSRYLAKRGYTVISIDYRHAPKYTFPVQLNDIQLALSYIHDHPETLGVDLERVAIMGRSAGGHLATLATLQPGAIAFKALINYYGPINLTEAYFNPPRPDPINTREILKDFLGGTPETRPELYQQASPISYTDIPFVPTLLVYPSQDHLVQAKYARELYEKLKARGNQVVFLDIPWSEHAFDEVFRGLSNRLVLYYTEAFLVSLLKI
ncbi:MAG: alpha/beta hydrolase [Gloeocapsa sp. DLM2.Bin57]|nr:MAG: alpha/beta hydrolase [Gloeocapsa sp. DLM2.Bin57]